MSERSYTKEQEVIVEQILQHKSHEYYKILDVEKTANESEIKKAYRKISLKVHPDKNGHPKADESFKKVAKAFEVLSDVEKRRIYDQIGSDPDSRGNIDSRSQSARAHMGSMGQGRPFFRSDGSFGGWQYEASDDFRFHSAENLFDMFFGNRGPSFDNSGTTFTFNSRRRPPNSNARSHSHFQQQQAPLSFSETIKSYLPWIIMLLIPMISHLFAEDQTFQFNKKAPYVRLRSSKNYNVPYYITEKQFKTLTNRKLQKIDRDVEMSYISTMQDNCARETSLRDRMIQDSYGWFFTDEEKLKKAQNMKMPNCEKLQQLGLWLF